MMLRVLLSAAGLLLINCRPRESDSLVARPMRLAIHDAGEGTEAFETIALDWERCRVQDGARCWLNLARSCAERAKASPVFVECARRSYLEFLRLSPDAGEVGPRLDDTNLFRDTP
jgi:hypothetical protein